MTSDSFEEYNAIMEDIRRRAYVEKQAVKVAEQQRQRKVAPSSTHNHSIVSGDGYSYNTNTLGGYTTGSGTYTTPIWQGTSPVPTGRYTTPSWDDLLVKVVQTAVADAMKEVTETLKDLQEQIDEIWESLSDE